MQKIKAAIIKQKLFGQRKKIFSIRFYRNLTFLYFVAMWKNIHFGIELICKNHYCKKETDFFFQRKYNIAKNENIQKLLTYPASLKVSLVIKNNHGNQNIFEHFKNKVSFAASGCRKRFLKPEYLILGCHPNLNETYSLKICTKINIFNYVIEFMYARSTKQYLI